MTASVVDIFRAQNAQIFLNDFNTNSYYMLLGNQEPYSAPASDTVPPQAYSYVAATYDLWRAAYGAKLIPASNVVACIPRINWTSGVVYNQYDAYDTSLMLRQFYVMNSNYQVYKCLSNNGNAASTQEPTSTATAAFQTSDGYRWKYMYTITAPQAAQFVTTSFIPVYLVSSNTTAAGSIESFRLTAGGTGYAANSSTIPVTISGDGTGAIATAYSNGSGIITHLEVTNSGSGYTYATVTIGGTGSNATALANLSPQGGHGANNYNELFARYAMVELQFQYNEGGNISVATSFRQVALIKNPIDHGTSAVATATSYDQAWRVTFNATPTGTYTVGEKVNIVRSSVVVGSAYVVEYNTTSTPILSLNFVEAPGVSGSAIAAGDTITGVSSSASGVVNTPTAPGLTLFTGSLFYYEDRVPVARAINQIENILVIFEY